jgi:hypothetical protein
MKPAFAELRLYGDTIREIRFKNGKGPANRCDKNQPEQAQTSIHGAPLPK